MTRLAIVAIALIAMAAVHVNGGSLKKKYQKLILSEHNDIRREQGSSDINELVWSDELAKAAKKWVGKCNFEHQNEGWGENLAYGTGKQKTKSSISQAMDMWYNEIDHFNYNADGCGKSCHFTQMIWYDTTQVGCAIKKCKKLEVGETTETKAWFVGCFYDPIGNWAGKKPYTQGRTCSDCMNGQTCHHGLCHGSGTSCEDKHKHCAMFQLQGACKFAKAKLFLNAQCAKTCGFCSD